jgi:hypothetical protein
MRPGICLGALFATAVAIETNEFGLFKTASHFYDRIPPLQLSLSDLLLLALIVAVAAERARADEPITTPKPMSLPLLLLALATIAGIVVGLANHGDTVDILDSTRRLVYLTVLPVLVVNVVRTRADVERALTIGAALAVFKGVEGMVAWLLHKGPPVYGTTLTYYSPTANWVMLLLVLFVLAAALTRTHLPWWQRLGAPIALAALALAFRRNFWIAAALDIALVLMLARASIGRRLVVPAAVVIVAAVAIGITAGSGGRGQNPVIERARSLSPAKVQANSTDRYRIDEEKNVWAEIKANPVVGLGLGVPWIAQHPLSEEHTGGRLYVHVIALWYWLKLGLLGLAGYVWLMAAAVVAAYRVARESVSARLRAAGLALATGLIGLAVAETTGSYTGVDVRFTMTVPVILGWIAAAYMAARREEPTA